MRYIYSACVVIETADIVLLCDPWFTDGVYDGSWYHFPKVDDPMPAIGDVDYIYISHIHPDHYDPDFLRAYEQRFGPKEYLVAPRPYPYLERSLRGAGFSVHAPEEALQFGLTSVSAIPIRPEDPSEIDSALSVEYQDGAGRRHSVLNVNDIVFDDELLSSLSSRFPRPDILLLGYTGAGPYPQTYFDLDDPLLPVEAAKKREAFFDRYRRNIDAFQARINIPFAGKYLLGGERTGLNDYRGVADAVEVTAFDHRAVVLTDLVGEISTTDLIPSSIRTEPYKRAAYVERCLEISNGSMAYELIGKELIPSIPFEMLLMKAYQRARSRSAAETDHFFAIHLPDGRIAELNANKNAVHGFQILEENAILHEPRSEIFIDPRYLFGLLTGLFHWNTAEVGSQYDVRRSPNVFKREAQQFLNFLSI